MDVTKLRDATLEDFEEFKNLYSDISIHCLTSPVELQQDVKSEEELTDEEKRHIIEMQILAEEYLEMYKEYSINDYERDLSNNLIFVLEVDGKIEGYFMISLFE